MPRVRAARLLRRVLRTVWELGSLGPLAAFTVIGPAVGALVLVASAGSWLPPLQAQGLGAVPWVLVGTVVLAALGLIPTHASSLVAGMLFGVLGGSALALLGTAAAALVGHRLVRRLVGERAVERLASSPRSQAVHAELIGRGLARTAGLVALLRLSPLMPFAATNLLLASAGVKLRAFLLGTVLGIAPRVMMVAAAGAGLSELDLDRASDVRLLVLGLIATAIALAVIGHLARRALRRVARFPIEA